MARAVLWLVFAAFGVYSTYVLYDVGYIGIFRGALKDSGGIQVLCDLCISLSLVCVWMARDARKHGRRAWPFLLATVFLGSFGPLSYLLLRPRTQGSRAGISGSVAANLIN